MNSRSWLVSSEVCLSAAASSFVITFNALMVTMSGSTSCGMLNWTRMSADSPSTILCSLSSQTSSLTLIVSPSAARCRKLS